jgi:hypothetical protein
MWSRGSRRLRAGLQGDWTPMPLIAMLFVAATPFVGTTVALGRDSGCDEVVDVSGPAQDGGVKLGDCVVGFSREGGPLLNLCGALKDSTVGEAISLSLVDGGVKTVRLAACEESTYSVLVVRVADQVTVQSASSNSKFEDLKVDRSCSVAFFGPCGPVVFDHGVLRDACVTRIEAFCPRRKDADAQPATLRFDSVEISISLKNSEQPPPEWRCRLLQSTPRIFRCFGQRTRQ